MSIDVEARIRRANLLPRDEQLEQLYDPDLSNLLLDDTRALKEGRMTRTNDRIDTQDGDLITEPDVEIPGPAQPKRRRESLRPAIAIGMMIAVAAVFVAIAGTRPTEVASPSQVAERFIEARNAYDADAVLSLLAPDSFIGAEIHPFVKTTEDYPDLIAVERAEGRQMLVEECIETPNVPGKMVCSYMVESDISRALGVGPFGGSRLNMVIEDGQIKSIYNRFSYRSYNALAFEPYLEWLEKNHPGEIDIFFGEAGLPASPWVDLWEQRIDEFVAHIESGGTP